MTKEEWFWEEDEESWDLYSRQISHPFKVIKAPKKSEEYSCYWPTKKQANLIAAAPEMLEALKAAFIAIQTLDVDALGMGEAIDENGMPYQYPFRNELLHNIHAAIAKAEGQL